MKHYTVFLLISLLTMGAAHAQEEAKSTKRILVTIPISRTDYAHKVDMKSQGLLQKLQKLIGSRFPSSFTNMYKVVPSYGVADVRTIETFEHRVYVDLDVYLRLRGQGFHQDSLLRKYSATGSGDSERTATQKALELIFSANNGISTYPDFLDSLFNQRYNIHGDATLAALKSLPLTSVKDCDRLLVELSYFADYPSMQDKVKAFEEEVISTRTNLFCEKEIQAIKIKVNSAWYDTEDIIKSLLAISPEASCSGEVLEIAKLIGRHQQENKIEKASDQLILLIEVHRDKNMELWREKYRE